MNLPHILILSLFSLLVCWLIPSRWRGWFLLVASLLAIFWLQPGSTIRNLDFYFPFVSLALTIIVWAVTRPSDERIARIPWKGLLLILGIVIAIAITRYIDPICCLTPNRPPQLPFVLISCLLLFTLTATLVRFPALNRLLSFMLLFLIIAIFIVLKTERISELASVWLRTLTGQDISLASVTDLEWLGFSFLAFRLLHVLRDYQNQKLPSYSLQELVTYGLFFPAYTAGPIDRSQRFIGDLRETNSSPARSTVEGSWRILIGIFKKFVLADSLALISLNATNADQTTSTIWMWALLYAYSLRIYFDFSGYTDIALGMGQFLGVKLPENFASPYLKTNLTAFWNSWHITLAQWFRAYYFNPITRALRTRSKGFPTWLIILFGQISTMLLIGLWHGVTWNFAIWGLWHGAGLFIHNRWSDLLRLKLLNRDHSPGLRRALNIGGWLLTFQFVTLGWVWFALPDLRLSLNVFRTLLGG